MGAKTLLTFEQFEQLPDDGLQHQLLRGELIVLPPPKLHHSLIQERLRDLLQRYVQQHRMGRVHMEFGFRLSADTWLQPDVSFVRPAQIERAAPDRYYEGAPALAIEIVSDSNTAAGLDLKVEEYFAHGAEQVWVVYPKTKKVLLHFPDRHIQTAAGDELHSGLFPGYALPLGTLFEA